MAHAEQSGAPALNINLDAADRDISNQLYYMLIMLCKGPALRRVTTSGAAEGLEAWRRLVLHHEPKSQVHNTGLMQELLGFNFEGDIAARLTQFDHDCAFYEAQSEEPIGENMKIGILLRHIPEGGLRQHLVLNVARLLTWDSMKVEIENIRRAAA